jgi:hypothetical protein
VPRKIGMAPIQREGMEYEFTLFAEMDLDHNFCVSKSRIQVLADHVCNKPGADLAKTMVDWLNSGAAHTEEPQAAAPKRATMSALHREVNERWKKHRDAHGLETGMFGARIKAAGFDGPFMDADPALLNRVLDEIIAETPAEADVPC